MDAHSSRGTSVSKASTGDVSVKGITISLKKNLCIQEEKIHKYGQVQEEDEEEDVDSMAELLAQSGSGKPNPGSSQSTSSHVPHLEEDGDDEDVEEDDKITAETLAKSGYNRSEPHPRLASSHVPHVEEDDEDEDEDEYNDEEDEEDDDIMAELLAQSGYYKAEPRQPPPVSLRGDVKLVSAFKGSREKQGITTPEKRTVTWAPDVKDPDPTHEFFFYEKSKGQRRQKLLAEKAEKKNIAKEKQRVSGKASGGGDKGRGPGGEKGRGQGGGVGQAKGKCKGKDKKQAQKYGRSSNKRFNSPNDD